MKYLIIGAGGTGGAMAAYLSRAGQEVALIARGEHLAAIRENGLRLELPGEAFVTRPSACTMEEYEAVSGSRGAETEPDIAFVCVKGYSMGETAAFLRKTLKPRTVVIPILNIYGTGRQLQEELPDNTVTDGCMYITSQKKAPGVIKMNGPLFRVVFGLRKDTEPEVRELVWPILEKVAAELRAAGIKSVLSEQIEADAFRKFTLISPMASLGAAYGTQAMDMQAGGRYREAFISLVRELMGIAEKQGIELPQDMVHKNLDIMDHMAPETTASMQRDVASGHASEVDGLVYEVVRMGEKAGAEVPEYRKIAAMLRERGLK